MNPIPKGGDLFSLKDRVFRENSHFPRQYVESIVESLDKISSKVDFFKIETVDDTDINFNLLNMTMAMFPVPKPTLRNETKPPQLRNSMLDPYTCIVKKNRKYASECTEASHLWGETLFGNGRKLRGFPYKFHSKNPQKRILVVTIMSGKVWDLKSWSMEA